MISRNLIRPFLFILFLIPVYARKRRPNEGPYDSNYREYDPMSMDPTLTDEAFYEELHTTMRNFHPKAYLNVLVSGRNSEKLYEYVDSPSKTIRGIFYTLPEDGEDVEINLIIKSPKGDELYNKTAAEGIFSFVAKIPGEYSFEFINSNWLSSIAASFIIGTDDQGLLLSEHIESASSNLARLKSSIDGIYNQYHYLWYRGQKQVAIAIKEQKKLLFYAIAQFVLILGCSFVGVWNIKKMLCNTYTV